MNIDFHLNKSTQIFQYGSEILIIYPYIYIHLLSYSFIPLLRCHFVCVPLTWISGGNMPGGPSIFVSSPQSIPFQTRR